MSWAHSPCATYDSALTGPPYEYVIHVNGSRRPAMHHRFYSPFALNVLRIGWWDLLKGLLSGKLLVSFQVVAPKELQEDVAELDRSMPTPERNAERIRQNRAVYVTSTMCVCGDNQETALLGSDNLFVPHLDGKTGQPCPGMPVNAYGGNQ